MLKRKPAERTTEDAPDSIAPWEMLEDAQIASITAALQPHFTDKTIKAFARRIDNDLRACFVMGSDNKAKGVLVVHAAGGVEKSYPSFTEWFDEALREAGLG